MRRSILLCLLFFSLGSAAFAQVGIGTTTPNPRSILQLVATDKGFLPPQLTTPEVGNVFSGATPAEQASGKGMIVVDTVSNQLLTWDGTAWVDILSGGNLWSEFSGNVFRSTGNVGVGTGSPAYKLDVTGDINTLTQYRLAGETVVQQNAANGSVIVGRSNASAASFNNTVMGVDAGNAMSSGNSNTFVGRSAGLVNDGFLNTFLGSQAGLASTGNNNTFLGAQAGLNTSAGVGNVFIGTFAGLNNVTGTNNVVIGDADVISSNLSNAIAIGYQAEVDASNTMVLGGTGLNAVNVGIGVNSPLTRLHIAGEADQAIFVNSTASGEATLALQSAAGILTTLISDDAAGEFLVNVDGNDAIIVEPSNGNVGIGTPVAATARLQVNGDLLLQTGTNVSGIQTDITGFETSDLDLLTARAINDAITNAVSASGGSLDEAYDNGGAGLGRTITADGGAVEIAGTDGLLVTGTQGTGATIPALAPSARMFFNPRKAAFRAGNITGFFPNNWNDANVGNFSVGMGQDVLASADYSVAMGEQTVASGFGSVAIGGFVQATGNYSAAFGGGSRAFSAYEVAVGGFNTPYVPNSTFGADPLDRQFVVGNGSPGPGNESDALVILKNGNTGIGTSTPTRLLDVAGTSRFGGDMIVNGFVDINGGLTLLNGTDVTGIQTSIGPFTGSDMDLLTAKAINDAIVAGDLANASPWLPAGVSDIQFSAGNVGIGIASPTERLYVDGGNLRVDNGQIVIAGGGSTSTLRMQGNGRNMEIEFNDANDNMKFLINGDNWLEMRQDNNIITFNSTGRANTFELEERNANAVFSVDLDGADAGNVTMAKGQLQLPVGVPVSGIQTDIAPFTGSDLDLLTAKAINDAITNAVASAGGLQASTNGLTDDGTTVSLGGILTSDVLLDGGGSAFELQVQDGAVSVFNGTANVSVTPFGLFGAENFPVIVSGGDAVAANTNGLFGLFKGGNATGSGIPGTAELRGGEAQNANGGQAVVRGGSATGPGTTGGDVALWGGNGTNADGNVLLAWDAFGTIPRGNVGVGTDAPAATLDVEGTFQLGSSQIVDEIVTTLAGATNSQLPTALAVQNAISASGGSLDEAYDNGGAGLGRTITADGGAVEIGGTDGLLVSGTIGSGAAIGAPGGGTRMFFNPRKAAFRAGLVGASQWDDANVGDESFAFGGDNTASAIYTAAWGAGNTASDQLATAWGNLNTASGERSTTWGTSNNAIELLTTAWGSSNNANGPGSTVWGALNTATGSTATVWGTSNNATNTSTTVWGIGNTASGDYATAWGNENTASSFVETVFGTFATVGTGNATAFDSGDRLLTVGNGPDAANRSDALVILKNGNTGIGTNAPGATLDVEGTFQLELGPSVDEITNVVNAGSFASQLPTAQAVYDAIQTELGPYDNTPGDDITTSTLAGGDLAGTYPNPVVTGIDNIPLNTSAYSDGEVLTYQAGQWVNQPIPAGGGTLDAAYDFGGAGLGRTITADGGAVQIGGTDGLLVTGTIGSGAGIGTLGAGTRMFFNPRKAAFRAGNVISTQWDDANVGENSFAFGRSNTASGDESASWGEFNIANGQAATAWGLGNTASGQYSTAWGSNNTAATFAETVLGTFATIGTGNATAFDPDDRLLTVGNGLNSSFRNDALVILKNGNTGIGTSTPGADLDVNGTFRLLTGNSVNDITTVVNGSSTNNQLPTAAAVFSAITGASGITGADNGLTNNSGTVELGGLLNTPTTVTLGASDLTFNTAGTGQLLVAAGPEQLRIRPNGLTSTGLVGSFSIEANGSSYSISNAGGISLTSAGGTTGTPIQITAGAGTSSPGEVDIASGNAFGLGNDGADLRIRAGAGGMGGGTGGDVIIYSSGAALDAGNVILAHDGIGVALGNVGIGTNNPQARLDIQGTFQLGSSQIVDEIVTTVDGTSTNSQLPTALAVESRILPIEGDLNFLNTTTIPNLFNQLNIVQTTYDSNPADDITFSSPAGGDLAGTYPNPNVVAIDGVALALTTLTDGEVLTYQGGDWVNLPGGDITSVTTGTGIAGGGSSGDVTIGLANTTVVPGTYNSNSTPGQLTLPSFTVDPQGRLTAAGTSVFTVDTDPTDDLTSLTQSTGITISGIGNSRTIAANANSAIWNANALQNRPVSATAPTAGQVLQFNAGQWLPTTLPTGGDITGVTAGAGLTGGGLSGDVTLALESVGPFVSDVVNQLGNSVTIPEYLFDGFGRFNGTSTATITVDSDPTDDITTATPASGDLSGLYPTPTVVALQGNPVSTTAPTPNQVLQFTGLEWEPVTLPSATNIFEDNAAFIRNFAAFDARDYVFGSQELESVAGAAPTRMQFMKSAGGAFRVGEVQGDQWDISTNPQGAGSIGFGRDSRPEGDYSLVGGDDSRATGDAAFAMGNTALADGNYTFAFGDNTQISGESSFGLGSFNTVNGLSSGAVGHSLSVNSGGSYAFGQNATVSAADAMLFNLGATPSTLSTASTFAFTGGNVGIGTTNPAATLTVNGDFQLGASQIVDEIVTDLSTASDQQLPTALAVQNAISAVGGSLWTDASPNIHYNVAGGNVGIGTATPTNGRLEVDLGGSAANATTIYATNSSTGAAAYAVQGRKTGSGSGGGVFGFTSSTAGDAAGVLGTATAAGYGVRGLNLSTAANSAAVFAEHQGATGNTTYGLRANNASTNFTTSAAVFGQATRSAKALYGQQAGTGTDRGNALFAESINSHTVGTTTARILNATTSTTNAINKTGLIVETSGAWTGANARSIGLEVAVSGATENIAALFNGGNVGIGTGAGTFPTQALEVNGNVELSGANIRSFQFDAGNRIEFNEANDAIRFYNGSAEYFALDDGTSTIRFNNGGNADILTVLDDVGGQAFRVDLGSTTAGNVSFMGHLAPNNLPGTSGFVLTSNGANASPTWTDPSTLGGGSLWTDASPDIYYDVPGGNVGIGTSLPSAPLDVQGNVNLGAVAKFSNSNSGSSLARGVDVLINDGNLAGNFVRTGNIGTAGVLRVENTGATSSGYALELVQATGNTGAFLAMYKGSAGSPSDIVTIFDENGNLGIGTNSPNQPLHVNGSARIGDYTLLPSSGTSGQVLTLNGSNQATWQNPPSGGSLWTEDSPGATISYPGNVGIGFTTFPANPAHELSVNGIARVSKNFSNVAPAALELEYSEANFGGGRMLQLNYDGPQDFPNDENSLYFARSLSGQVQAFDALGQIMFGGGDGSGSDVDRGNGGGALIEVYPPTTWDVNNHHTEVDFYATAQGENRKALAMTVHANNSGLPGVLPNTAQGGAVILGGLPADVGQRQNSVLLTNGVGEEYRVVVFGNLDLLNPFSDEWASVFVLPDLLGNVNIELPPASQCLGRRFTLCRPSPNPVNIDINASGDPIQRVTVGPPDYLVTTTDSYNLSQGGSVTYMAMDPDGLGGQDPTWVVLERFNN